MVPVHPRMLALCNTSWRFFFTDTATAAIYPLSLHDALPISWPPNRRNRIRRGCRRRRFARLVPAASWRSEEHTSELQSPDHLVCRLLLEKKKKIKEYRGSSTTESTTVVVGIAQTSQHAEQSV